jgi:hypothetical protein
MAATLRPFLAHAVTETRTEARQRRRRPVCSIPYHPVVVTDDENADWGKERETLLMRAILEICGSRSS